MKVQERNKETREQTATNKAKKVNRKQNNEEEKKSTICGILWQFITYIKFQCVLYIKILHYLFCKKSKDNVVSCKNCSQKWLRNCIQLLTIWQHCPLSGYTSTPNKSTNLFVRYLWCPFGVFTLPTSRPNKGFLQKHAHVASASTTIFSDINWVIF